MPRYFIEVAYKGTAYSGFQVQKNAVTIQSEVESALKIYFKQEFFLTGASRTDKGVHALQNYFHFDVEQHLQKADNTGEAEVTVAGGLRGSFNLFRYNLNAILPGDIVIRRIFPVEDKAHCRFDAISREYEYFLYFAKDPFLQDRAYYFPFNIDIDKLNAAAALIKQNADFTSFSKKNTQVNNFICTIKTSEWIQENNTLVYRVAANRFLRGMVKGLVGSMLLVATNKITLEQFESIIIGGDSAKVNFSVPPHALFLTKVAYK